MAAKKAAQVPEYRGVDLSMICKVIDCYHEDKIDRETADETGLTLIAVHGVRTALGLKANRKHVSSRARRDAARAMAGEGKPVSEIASILRTPVSTVEGWLHTNA